MQQDDIERQAQEAIARGADPTAVQARLRQIREAAGYSLPPGAPPVIYGPPRQPSPQTAAQAQGDVLSNQNMQSQIEQRQFDNQQRAQQTEDRERAQTALQGDIAVTMAAIDRALARIRRYPNWTTGWASYLASLPSTEARALNADLDTIRANVTFDKLQRIRQSSPNGASVGNVSDTDMRLLGASAGTLDQGLEAGEIFRSLSDIGRRYENTTRAMGFELPEARHEWRTEDRSTPTDRLGVNTGIDESRQTVIGFENMFGDPVQPDNSNDIRAYTEALMQRGVAAEEIRTMVNQRFGVSISPNDEGLRYYEETGQVPGVVVPPQEQPRGAQLSPLATALLSGMDAASLNIPSATASNYDPEGYAGLQVARANSPNAAFAGDVAGYVGGGLATAPVAAASAARFAPGLAASRLAPYAGTAAEGAIVGQNVADDPLTGAVGGALSRAVMGRFAAPNRAAADESVLAAHDAGYRLTPGQVLGGAARDVEERMSSLPLVRTQINARQMEGIGDFNRSIVNRGLEPIGEQFGRDVPAGNRLINEAQQAAENAYGVLDNFAAPADSQLAQNLTSIRTRAQQLPPELRDEFNALFDDNINYLATGATQNVPITGRQAQDIYRTLSGEANRITNPSPAQRRYTDLVREARNEVQGWLDRVSPETGQGFRNANEAWRNMRTIENAASRSVLDQPFTPAQLLYGIRQEGGRRNFAGGNGFFEGMQREAQQAQNVLPNTLPTSGTAERGFGMGALIASGIGGATVSPLLAAPLLGAALVSKPTTRMAQRAALGRPGVDDYGYIREFIRQQGLGPAGLLGSGAATGLLAGY